MHILHKPFVIFIFYLCIVLEYEDLETAIESALKDGHDDMYKAGIPGVLTTEYKLDVSYLPNVWRFSLLHNGDPVFASEFVLDNSMTPQISEYEYDCLYLTLAGDFIAAMQEHSVIPFLTRRRSNDSMCIYVRLESLAGL